jgi:hypothetical protein
VRAAAADGRRDDPDGRARRGRLGLKQIGKQAAASSGSTSEPKIDKTDPWR